MNTEEAFKYLISNWKSIGEEYPDAKRLHKRVPSAFKRGDSITPVRMEAILDDFGFKITQSKEVNWKPPVLAGKKAKKNNAKTQLSNKKDEKPTRKYKIKPTPIIQYTKGGIPIKNPA